MKQYCVADTLIFNAPAIHCRGYAFLWLKEYKKGSVRKNTYTSLENSIDNHIIPYFGNFELKKLTPALYQKFLNKLYDDGLAKNTRLRIHNACYNALKRAVMNKKIASNPCEHAVIKGERKAEKLKYIDSQHVGPFLAVAFEYGYTYGIFFKVLVETGMRKGEAAALQWPDIDFKNGTISISKSLDFQAADESELFGDTKNYHSKRVISMGKSLADALRFHANWQNQNKTNLNEIYHHDLNLVLCRNHGNFMPKSSLFNAFSRILKYAGIAPLPIHSLRHTHAVLQLEAGADMKYVQERLGHGSMQITSDVYSHISKKIENRNNEKYEEYMRNLLK